MIGGYAKFGYLEVVRRPFDEMPEKAVVPWNAMIGGWLYSSQALQGGFSFVSRNAS